MAKFESYDELGADQVEMVRLVSPKSSVPLPLENVVDCKLPWFTPMLDMDKIEFPKFPPFPEDPVQNNAVNGPAHYHGTTVLEFINEFELGFELGNAVKYIARAELKDGGKKYLEDLRKAVFYIEWYIKRNERDLQD